MAPSTLTTAHRGRPAQVAHRTVKIFRNAYLDLQYGRPLAGKVETRYPHLGASPKRERQL